MINRIKKNLRSDVGLSGTIEFIYLILILWVVLVSVIDFGLYFNDRNIMTNAAQNGARLAAVYGGAGDTPVARQYGKASTSKSQLCAKYSGKITNNIVSCQVAEEIANTTGLVNAEVEKIDCGPDKTSSLGERTYCKVDWKYKGVAGYISFAYPLFNTTHLKMTAETEVVYR